MHLKNHKKEMARWTLISKQFTGGSEKISVICDFNYVFN